MPDSQRYNRVSFDLVNSKDGPTSSTFENRLFDVHPEDYDSTALLDEETDTSKDFI